ncbi:MAG: replication factor C small subunit [Candidatus Methylarchaceae archaeon HK01M]|nr:replication factor C small subunit [Candidatus Methylarchaceae archaeon HK01M]
MARIETLMWVEKYRPVELKDLVNQEAIVERLLSMLNSPREMPHLLFSGPPGTGKTTAALCIVRKILGESWRDYTLELNASDERGINIVRDRVKTFSRYVGIGGEAPLRIIILDEADEMTNDAQTALRRIMEESSRICRFILVCNYSSGIIEPIQSRCAIFRFLRLNEEDVVDYLRHICKEEEVDFGDKALSLIYEISGGDLRLAINTLQSSASFGKVNFENVKKTAGISGKSEVGKLVDLALRGEFKQAREKLLELMRVYGMSERDVIKYANEAIFKLDLQNLDEVAESLAKYDYRLIVGAQPDIQLTAMIAELGKIGKESGFITKKKETKR